MELKKVAYGYLGEITKDCIKKMEANLPIIAVFEHDNDIPEFVYVDEYQWDDFIAEVDNTFMYWFKWNH